jgi:hypothetical protein
MQNASEKHHGRFRHPNLPIPIEETLACHHPRESVTKIRQTLDEARRA